MDKYHCPICKVELEPIPRYPSYVCGNCAQEASDEAGRLLKFYNIDSSGGYIAKYVDTNEEYESHICYINAIKCYANEARFGGIVIVKK